MMSFPASFPVESQTLGQRWLKYVWLLIIVVLMTACTNSDLICEDALGCVTIKANDPIQIGTLLADSGAASFLGEDSRGGIEIAIDDRENGVLDHQIELVSEDTGCTVAKGKAAAQSLTAVSTIVGVIGTNCSNVTQSVMPVIDKAGLTMLSPSNTAPDLATNQLWRGAYARTAPSNRQQAEMTAVFAYEELQRRTAVILHDNSAYTNNLGQAFAVSWQDLGGTVLFESEMAIGQTDLSDILTRLSANPPDILYLTLFEPEANILVNALHGVPDLKDIVLLGTENLLVATFPQGAGEAVTGMYVMGTAVSSNEYAIFLAQWDVKFGGTPPAAYHAHAYDAANILLDAIEDVAQKSATGTLLIGKQALRQAIINTSGFAGLTGTLTCDERGDCASGTALGIYQITEAEITGEVWPPPLIWQPLP